MYDMRIVKPFPYQSSFFSIVPAIVCCVPFTIDIVSVFVKNNVQYALIMISEYIFMSIYVYEKISKIFEVFILSILSKI